MELDRYETGILDIIQGDFPISKDPYSEVGRKVGLSGDEVYGKVMGLIDRGILRKIGPFFDVRKLGHSSTLCAVEVPPDKLKKAVEVINSYPQITHNYLREGTPNVWFTIIAESKEAIKEIIDDISKKAGIGPIRDLPALKSFKIKVDLKVRD